MGGTSPDIIDSDAACRRYIGGWWPGYQQRRALAQETAALGSPYRTQFTRYPNAERTTPDVPIESFMGESFPPSKSGWHNDLWGCFSACQDLQRTWEWVLASGLEYSKQHVRGGLQVRAKATLAFECPAGMVSEEYSKNTLRESEAPEEVAAAISYLKSIVEAVQKQKNYPMTDLNLYGDPGPELTGCRCVEKSIWEARRLANQRMRDRVDRKGTAQEELKTARQKRVRHVAQVYAKKLKSENSENQQAAESSSSVKASASGDQDPIFAEIDDLTIPPNVATCHDYDFPENEIGLPPLPEQPNIPIPDLPDFDEQFEAFLSAFLDEFSGYQAGSFGTASPKGPPPS